MQSAVDLFDGNSHKPQTIHRCRVALKRARALAFVGSVSAPGLAEIFDDSARALMRTLGAARDNWVIERTARALASRVGRKSRRELEALADRIEVFRRTTPSFNEDSVRAGFADLLAIAQVWPEASPRQVERGVRRVAKQAQRAWRHARKAEQPDRHAWRKREKARLYAASLLPAAWPNGRPRRRKRNAKLAQILGDERDLVLLMQRLEADHPADGAPRALPALSKAKKRIVKRADRLGKRLHSRRG
ncbi:MAG: CHAD domain-containing protein [Terricaulis sp.]